MYTSKYYAITDREVALRFIQTHDFGVVTAHTTSGLMATHVPLLLESEGQERITLLGHFARGNPQAKLTEEGAEVLVSFAGPHAYISPSAYRDEPDVPTWNYQAVHAHGLWRRIEDARTAREHLLRMIEKQERRFARPWNARVLDPKLFVALERGIVAFRIEVTRLEGAFKLSQDKSAVDRRSVIDWLGESSGSAAEVAQAMRELYGE